jgi:L-lactate dehydrogenase complex protein LldE
MTAAPSAQPSAQAESAGTPRVGLFATCLVDLFRPSVGFAAIALLERAGADVVVPARQTCCGQPAWNSGDVKASAAIARQVIAAFEDFDYVVAPSGSCAGMLKEHFPRLLAEDADWQPRAAHLAARTHELVSFLVDIMGMDKVEAEWPAKATYHDSCSGLRELGVKAQPRALLGSVAGLELTELPGAETCCGFGGTFCVKYPDISNRMVTDKAADITATGASLLLAGDLGCLMNMAGKLKREGSTVEVRHVAEVLAGERGAPGIGDPGTGDGAKG